MAASIAAPPGLFDLTGHLGLVTGGNGGIGLGMARGLKAAGADIAIWGTNADKTSTSTAATTCTSGTVEAGRERGDADFPRQIEHLPPRPRDRETARNE